MKDDELTKYGVDKTDPVEARAGELEKTGMDKNEARKQAKKERDEKREDSQN